MNTRKAAAGILQEVLEQGGKSHILLHELFQKHPELDNRDRSFITGLVHGTLERVVLLDYRLSEVSSVPVRKLKPYIRTVLRLGLYQLLFLDRIPASAAVNESVLLIKEDKRLKELAGFVNGVLRTAADKTDWRTPDRATALSMPKELYARFERDLGRKKAKLACESFLEPSVLTVRINESRTDKDTVLKLFAAAGYEAVPSRLLPEVLELNRTERSLPLENAEPLAKGLVQIQDPSSVTAIHAAAPKPGMKVLDLCAAPGGKSLHAADLLRGEGAVLSLDLTEEKVKKLEENIRRSGLSCIRAEAADATVFVPERENQYDLVIADLPCSGLGVIGRKPEIRLRITEEQIRDLAALQREILKHAVRYVKPGGLLLFSTCTTTREENRDNAAWLETAMGLFPELLEDRLPEALKRAAWNNTLQLVPGEFGTDGFFISLFRKMERN